MRFPLFSQTHYHQIKPAQNNHSIYTSDRIDSSLPFISVVFVVP